MELNKIYQGDSSVAIMDIPDKFIDCCVTSPPYYGLRDYGCENQIGLEETPEIYIEKLVKLFSEVWRTLKDDGTLWVNIGDSYAGSGKGAWSNKKSQKETYAPDINSPQCKLKKPIDIKAKDLIGIPWMLAFALRQDGWYLRQDIIWSKPNPTPESVKDRCTKSHEYIFLLSKSQNYFFDNEAIKEPSIYGSGSRANKPKGSFVGKHHAHKEFKHISDSFRAIRDFKNKRDVWTVATKAYRDAHFATFPKELIEPCILAGTRKNGVVLDPFMGSGTTGLSAIENQRNFIGIELNPDYIRIANDRIKPVLDQVSMYDFLDAEVM